MENEKFDYLGVDGAEGKDQIAESTREVPREEATPTETPRDVAQSTEFDKLFEEHVRSLSILRKEKEELKADYDAKFEVFRKVHTLLFGSLEFNKTRITEVEAIIRETAPKIFKITKMKKLFGGIGITENKVLLYDAAEALKWAKEKGIALQLDKKAFEAFANNSDELTFVKKDKVPKATVPNVIVFKEDIAPEVDQVEEPKVDQVEAPEAPEAPEVKEDAEITEIDNMEKFNLNADDELASDKDLW